MKLRAAALAFLLGSLVTGVCWLTLQPELGTLLDVARRHLTPGSPEALAVGRLGGALPLLLGLDLALATALAYAVLHWAVVRPLEDTEAQVARLAPHGEAPAAARPEGGGPLLARVQRALARTAEALRREEDKTRAQVAALREANARLARTQTELVARERLATVGKLAAGVAHEVGNPLSGILGYLSLAQAEAREAPVLADYLARTEAEVRRIDGIVRGLLDLGRQARGTPLPVPLAAHLDTTLRLVRAGPDFHDVAVDVAVPPGLVVHADPGALSQVLINLLVNAAQAMEGRGRLILSAERAGERVVLAVEDTGPGLPPGGAEQLFEPFYTTKPPGKGTGLGLAVARHLVDGMGGRLDARERPGGQGARFELALPAA